MKGILKILPETTHPSHGISGQYMVMNEICPQHFTMGSIGICGIEEGAEERLRNRF